MSELLDHVVAYLLEQRRWYDWPQADELSIDAFQDATMAEIKALLENAGRRFSDDQIAAIAGRLWRRLRGE